MIKSFKDRETEKLFNTGKSRKYNNFLSVALRKLDMIYAAVILSDLRIPPANRLEALKGDRIGQHSIRINDQYRICFIWSDGAENVEIIDYHWERGEKMTRIKTHPGEILKEEFLIPFGVSARQLALAIDIPANRLTEIIRGNRGITADTALRLSRIFGTTAEFWMNLQMGYDLSVTAKAEAQELKKIKAIAA